MLVFPNAKINIGLRVLRKRPDGYHDIETLFCPIQWTDILEITPSKGIEDEYQVYNMPSDCRLQDNLIYKAIQGLRKDYTFPPCRVELVKQIPSQAGLGGGSSDASFVLSTINALFQLDIPTKDLSQIALSLGADCPFFLNDQIAIGEGTGTTLTPVKNQNLLKGYTIVVVAPHITISTREAYERIVPNDTYSVSLEALSCLPIEMWQDNIQNDFETSLFPLYPELSEIKDTLYRLGASYSSLSGSGSALYAFFKTPISNIASYFPPHYTLWIGIM